MMATLYKLFRKRELPADAAAFSQDWLDRRHARLCESGLKITLVANTMILALLWLFSPSHPWVIAGGHGLIELLLVGWALKPSRNLRTVSVVVVLGEVLCVAIYGGVLWLNFAEHVAERFLVMSAATYLAFTLIFTILNPLGQRSSFVLSIVYVAFGYAALSPHPVALPFAMMQTVSLAGMGAFYRMMDRASVTEAIDEFYHRQVERLRAELERDRDLEFAREVQESMLPASSYESARLDIRFGQRKHERIGGDWLAIRGDGDRAVVVVADAAGKGVHAGLVVQAVQTLWARSLGAPLDPRQWIEEVNSVLCQLGRQKPQTMTLGLVAIDAQGAVYWSAGHVPVYLKTADDKVVAVCGQGNVLGLGPGLGLAPKRLDLGAGTATLLLGSDGVFGKGTRYPKAELTRMFDAAEASPETLLEGPGEDDDRSVVVIRVREPGAKGQGFGRAS